MLSFSNNFVRLSAGRIIMCAAVVGIAVGTEPAYAQEPMLPAVRSPLPSVQAAQGAREPEIVEHLRTALKESAAVAERQDALSSLGGVEYDYVLANGEALVLGPPDLAVQTVSMIGAEIAMLPNEVAHAEHEDASDPLSRYQIMVVNRSEELLEVALGHPEARVRLEAGAILAARGNPRALSTIDSMIKDGEIGAREGLGYLSLAPNQIAAPFVASYASADDPGTQAAAVAQLAYNPSYTEQVREIALSPSAPTEVTAAALPGLARTDSTFLEYGVALAADSERPVRAREVALREALNMLKTDQAITSSLENAVAGALKGASIDLSTDAALEAYRVYEMQIDEN